ncbi:MAG: dTDP-4-dehydrorhamnose 3,5-epimerase [Endomicrobium sp.]|jgi:dTDP-4-dehydrorhamnose 3,5-epimerase|nr:dTDP-4-dehydrorhamnose 3,5-epimerase [Endomicrobium sp.]
MDFFRPFIEGLVVITPKIFRDVRGYFFESYNKKEFEQEELTTEFVQDNQSFSSYGTIRGLHFQKPPYAQSKLVRVLQGKVFDVAVDLRKNSNTFGKWFGIELSNKNQKMFFIPRGFAHGFSVLSETAVFFYKCDNFYNKESEDGILLNDVDLSIDWKINSKDTIISEKDKLNKTFEEYKRNVCF